MRNMSFSMTTEQMYQQTQTVTRRLGWSFLKPGVIGGEQVSRLIVPNVAIA